MFGILRRVILVILVASASIVFWETSGLKPQGVREQNNSPSPENGGSTSPQPAPAEQPWSLIPGTPGQRFLVWALFVLLLPVVSATVAGRVFQLESNTANLVLLFGYTGVDVLAAWLVGGIQIGGLWSGIGYLVALLAVFAYNLWVCSLLAKFQEG